MPKRNTPDPRHEIFAQQAAAGKTYIQAALIAGYAKTTAETKGHRLAANPEIQARIAEIQQQMLNAQLVTAEKLHATWSEMLEADIADILHEDGTFKPIQFWPKIWRKMLSGIDIKEIFERSKDGRASGWDKVGRVVKLKWVSVKELGELIGRLRAVDAFVAQGGDEKHLHLHLHEQIESRLLKARELAARNDDDIIDVPENGTRIS